MNIIFIKTLGKSLTGSSKRHKTQKGGKYEDQHESVGARYVPLATKNRLNGRKLPKEQGAYKIFKHGVKPNWPQLNDLCSYAGLISL